MPGGTLLRIGRRYQGYPGLGQGGYLGGLLARRMGGHACSVAFRAPIPLEVDLAVEEGGEGLVVRREEDLIAEARPSEVTGPTAALVPAAAAEGAGASAPSMPVVDGCFSCGIGADTLGTRCGPVGGGRVATLWTPPLWSDEGGEVALPFVWAALDCAGFWRLAIDRHVPNPLTARLTVRVLEPLVPGEPHVLVAEDDGDWEDRRRRVRSAVYAGEELKARSEAVWVEPRIRG